MQPPPPPSRSPLSRARHPSHFPLHPNTNACDLTPGLILRSAPRDLNLADTAVPHWMSHTAPRCPTLPHTACPTLPAPHCLTLPHTASRCPTLPHTGCPTPPAPHCLPHTASRCPTLPHTGCPTLAAPHWLPHTGCPTLAAPHWLLHTGCSTLAAPHWLTPPSQPRLPCTTRRTAQRRCHPETSPGSAVVTCPTAHGSRSGQQTYPRGTAPPVPQCTFTCTVFRTKRGVQL